MTRTRKVIFITKDSQPNNEEAMCSSSASEYGSAQRRGQNVHDARAVRHNCTANGHSKEGQSEKYTFPFTTMLSYTWYTEILKVCSFLLFSHMRFLLPKRPEHGQQQSIKLACQLTFPDVKFLVTNPTSTVPSGPGPISQIEVSISFPGLTGDVNRVP